MIRQSQFRSEQQQARTVSPYERPFCFKRKAYGALAASLTRTYFVGGIVALDRPTGLWGSDACHISWRSDAARNELTYPRVHMYLLFHVCIRSVTNQDYCLATRTPHNRTTLS